MGSRKLTLAELQTELERTPLVARLHPVSECFLPDQVRIFPSSAEAAWFLDDPGRPVHVAALAREEHVLYSARFPVVECQHDPFTPALNQVLLQHFDDVRGRMLCQSQIADRLVSSITKDTQVVVFLLVDGLSYDDVRCVRTGFAAPARVDLTPCLVDVPSLTRVAFPNIVGSPSVANRLFDQGYYQRHGFSYWTRSDNALSDRIFKGIPNVEKSGAFAAILAAVETLLASTATEKHYIQILRTGLDGFVHSQKRQPPVEAIVEDILSELERLLQLLNRLDYRAQVFLTADHGILWRQDFAPEVVGRASAQSSARYCGWRELYDIQGQPRHRFVWEGEELYCLGHPHIRRPLRIDEQGVRGGISFQESVVPFLHARL